MRFKPPNCKRLQGAADARRRARRRTFVLQVPDNKADAVPCERLPKSLYGSLYFSKIRFRTLILFKAAILETKRISSIVSTRARAVKIGHDMLIKERKEGSLMESSVTWFIQRKGVEFYQAVYPEGRLEDSRIYPAGSRIRSGSTTVLLGF